MELDAGALVRPSTDTSVVVALQSSCIHSVLDLGARGQRGAFQSLIHVVEMRKKKPVLKVGSTLKSKTHRLPTLFWHEVLWHVAKCFMTQQRENDQDAQKEQNLAENLNPLIFVHDSLTLKEHHELFHRHFISLNPKSKPQLSANGCVS